MRPLLHVPTPRDAMWGLAFPGQLSRCDGSISGDVPLELAGLLWNF